ncbi:MAG: succinyl-diaminopimelate desuccinylase [Caulobacteraceae bacterium]|nr:succinyl-diaminopimelate desuccinylase [Caulobacteraceae bacterium]
MGMDPLALAQALIRRPSVTPADAGAMDVLQRELERLGFACRRMKFGEIENLYARRGQSSPNLCFAGHTDVVPVGDAAAWTSDPFEASVVEGALVGRGAVDMKGAIAAWVAAIEAVDEVSGSLSLLITGDEEGDAVDGTTRVVDQLAQEGEVIDACIVGEPSSAQTLGDMIKVGRRGSINAWIEVEGRQGHVAYPHRAANPVPVLVRLLAALQQRVLDDGYQDFPPSNLEITTVDVANPTTNLIPARAAGRLNIRFNPNHTGASLQAWIEDEAKRAGEGFEGKVATRFAISGEAFLTQPGALIELAAGAVQAETGLDPERSTSGGTSDARFIRKLCPVIELGLVGATMHAVDERAPVEEIRALSRIYRRVIEGFFAR